MNHNLFSSRQEVLYKQYEYIGDYLIETILVHHYIGKDYSRNIIKVIVDIARSNELLRQAALNAGLPNAEFIQEQKRGGSAFEYKIGKLLVVNGYDSAYDCLFLMKE